MANASPYIIILVTTKDKAQAAKIAKALLAEKLIACANIVNGGLTSLFRWEGKIDRAQEVLLILKTKRRLFKKIELTVRSLHSYKVPEIIALPVCLGNVDYLTWIDSSVA